MKRLKKLVIVVMTLIIAIGIGAIGVNAANLQITSIVANTYVGDGQREVSSFEITVNDINLVTDLNAEDFDITGNFSTIPLDLNGKNVSEYENDEISLSISENTITLSVKPFNYSRQWSVECNESALSFDYNDVTTLKTRTLDDALRGTFTYAGLTREYALYLPKNADGSAKQKVPLVVWNHGGGEYAGQLENTLVANRGLTAWSEAGNETAVLQIQVANQNYSYGAAFDEAKKSLIDQNNALQAALIKELISEGTVDADRIYVTGASSGGGATMRFVMQYPELFAGAIACCSMDPIVWVHWNNQDSYEKIVQNFETAFQGQVYTWDEDSNKMVTKDVDTEKLLELPIYFTHAQNDSTCSVNSSKAMYEALNNLGAKNNHLTIWSDAEMAEAGLAGPLLHWSWVKIFNSNEEGSPMNWLFKQTNALPQEPQQPQIPEKTEKLDDIQVLDNSPSKSVKTGDDMAVELMVIVMTLSLLAGVTLVNKKYI